MTKLSLTRETVATLTPQQAEAVAGGYITQAYSCGTCQTLHCGTSTCYTHFTCPLPE